MSLSPETKLEMLYTMILSRRLDERCWILHRQGKIAFHISAMGHEACQVGAAYAMRRGYDYFYPYYRDMTLCMAIGMTPLDVMLGVFGRKADPSSAARQMPSHFSHRELRIVSLSSPVATQVPQAAGTALAEKLKRANGQIDEDEEMAVSLVCLGEGSTSEGDWHEGLNWAGIHKLPFVCLVQNNIYAISVPMELQMPVENVADRGAAYGMPGVIVDGNDVMACYEVMKEAFDRARRGDGPTLVEAKTYRPVPHSSDDDDRTYRSREEVQEWKKKDPILRFKNQLLEEGILTEEKLAEFEERATEEVDRAHEEAEQSPFPDPEDALGDVYAPMDWQD